METSTNFIIICRDWECEAEGEREMFDEICVTAWLHMNKRLNSITFITTIKSSMYFSIQNCSVFVSSMHNLNALDFIACMVEKFFRANNLFCYRFVHWCKNSNLVSAFSIKTVFIQMPVQTESLNTIITLTHRSNLPPPPAHLILRYCCLNVFWYIRDIWTRLV